MKIVLKEFQEQAVARLARYMRAAAREHVASGDRQSVALSSTTGSGKTVMLTGAIEAILGGDDANAPFEDAAFLWITDDPQLNEQTRKKMLVTSSVLKAEQLIVIDATFDEETLRPGSVHFLNIQKIGKEKYLVTPGDKRTYGFWETVRNTIDAFAGRLFVIIDEAHRGMIEEQQQEEAASIVQKFIKGSPGEIPPVPVVIGISATPDRFNQLIAGTGRTHRSVDVDVADVRESGLIKETIVLHHPNQAQPTDMTMLREAARAFRRFTAEWATYCAANEDYTVEPLLVVQVEDAATKGSISDTDIAQGISILRSELGSLPQNAFAHAFQEGTTIQVAGENLRYLAPSDIQADPDVRVIFFKSSLNTGWDCPRAEVMMSFRKAADATYIAQLVGRMVRAPLVRRIVNNELLNTVPLYLPHYDARALQRIIAKLSRPDDGAPSVDIERSEDVIELGRAVGSTPYFDLLTTLPSYVVPRRRKANQVRRLMKFARLLANDAVDPDALATARKCMLDLLQDAYNRRKNTPEFCAMVDGQQQIEIEAVNWTVGTAAGARAGTVRVDIASENVEDLFEATGRKLNEGLHKIWWREQVRNGATNRDRVKLELFALCTDSELIKRLERKAQEQVQAWLTTHRATLAALDESSRALYQEIRNLAATPELTPLVYPAVIQGRAAETAWPKHVYVTEFGNFPAQLNMVESDLIVEILSQDETVAWLRNVDRKPWALCVPYEIDGEERSMYPDFLVIRETDGSLVVDIIDPHAINLADAPAKAAGLAKFADRHADSFGRINLIMVDGRACKTLDLAKETVRARVRGLRSHDQMKRLFAESD